MTPVIFVSFLLSLALVDFRYSVLRSEGHRNRGSRLPAWLHRIVYMPSPDQSNNGSSGNKSTQTHNSTGGQEDGYYHSKQKKLAKMEMADAFEIRGAVVAFIFGMSVVMSWGVWTAGHSLWRHVMT